MAEEESVKVAVRVRPFVSFSTLNIYGFLTNSLFR